MNTWRTSSLAVAAVAAVFSVGCSAASDDEASLDDLGSATEISEQDSTSESEEAAEADSTVETEPPPDRPADLSLPSVTSPDLDVTLPDEEPEVAAFEVIETGSGPAVGPGDLVLVAWEMVAFDTGEVVESTADDLGGPVPVQIGAGFVPAALDEALEGQSIGTRLEVQFPVGMEDLPAYLDADTPYVLAVQLVELVPAETAGPTTTAAPQPTTTAPAQDPDQMVAATGPLSASPPNGAPLPERNSFEVVAVGDGPALAAGDTIQLNYVVVSWTTGQVVSSTADQFGGPQSVVLGDQEVPRYLENAVYQQPVGSRVQVIYAPDLPDLPTGLSREDAFLIAVDIIGRS